MARILGVHGIGQQYRGHAVLHSQWWPALQSGVRLAGVDLTDSRDFECAFYAHRFRPPGTLGSAARLTAGDVNPLEHDLLHLLWEEAARLEPAVVPAPAEFAVHESLARVPLMIQRALNGLSRSAFFARIAQPLLIGDLRQVVQYINDPSTHDAILQEVLVSITEDTRVVIGHSLGSVIAYEALCRTGRRGISFISLGSPLGIRNIIYDRLSPRPTESYGAEWPASVCRWTNVADVGDVVALQRELAPLFGPQVRDVLVHNGAEAHHGERYLTSREVGEAVMTGLL